MTFSVLSRRAALLGGGALLTSCKAAFAEDRIAKIGLVQSTTGGSAALYGSEQKRAVELAFAELNASGRSSIRLQAVYADDGADRGQTVNIYQRQIRQDKVLAILGPSLSNSAFAADPIAQQAGVPVIASSNTAPNLTKIGDFIFRTSPPEDLIFPNVLAYAVKTNGIKRVALIYQIDDALSRGAHDVQARAVAAAGLTVVGTETFQHGDVDFSAQLTSIRDAKPDAIILGTLVEEAAAIMRQARDQLELPAEVGFIGCNANISGKLFELAGSAATGILVGAAWFPDYDNERSRQFVKAYKARYGLIPDIYAAQAYDAAYLLAQAIDRADTVTDGRRVRDQLAAISDFDGVMGRFGWTSDREVTVGAKILRGDGARFVPVAG